jgi:hypothetical protein
MIDSVLGQFHAVQAQYPFAAADLAAFRDDHTRILSALRLADAELAENRARRLVRRFAEQIRSGMQEQTSTTASHAPIERQLLAV